MNLEKDLEEILSKIKQASWSEAARTTRFLAQDEDEDLSVPKMRCSLRTRTLASPGEKAAPTEVLRDDRKFKAKWYPGATYVRSVCFQEK